LAWMLTWLLVAVGIYGVYWLFLRPATPIFYRNQHQSDAPRFVQSMFISLRPESVAHFEIENTRLRFRIRTIRLATDELGIRLEIPDSEDMRAMAGAIRARLERVGFACVPRPQLDRLSPAQDAPLLVTGALEASEAVRLVEAAREGMNLGPDTRYTIHMDGIPSIAATKEYYRKRNADAS
jgi:hypothetical protein